MVHIGTIHPYNISDHRLFIYLDGSGSAISADLEMSEKYFNSWLKHIPL